ncbi:MFS transporter [Alteraurantiacibacter aquimixticola]|uniref:MFS transporter n=1 Tax=Alteraurantiacibacter aquimixticola TaxID=2489173 RepID=A0A4T3F6H9_9SPHN|nr:MFS transporter [Alteraurantiacibacter aquimixticola]TIX52044.1 MFS transporter [Alteraurantiacibacter aquimixticola]
MDKRLPPLLVAVFINIAGFSLILPLLPFYGQVFGAQPFEIGLLFAAYSFGNVFGEIYWGRQSDRWGRRKVLVVTTFIAGLSYIAFAYAPTLWAAIGIRVFSGFFSGTLSVCQGFIADVSAPERRAKTMGYFGAAFSLGIAFGPVLGGVFAGDEVAAESFRLPIFLAGCLSVLASLWCMAVLRDAVEPSGKGRPLPKYSEAFAFVSSEPLLARLFVISFFGIAAFASMEAVYGLWSEANFGWSANDLGFAFLAIGGGGLFAQLVLIGPLVARFGEARVIVMGLALLALSMLLQPVIRLPISGVLLMGVLMTGHSLAFPSAGALLSRNTPPERQGSTMGLLMASNAVGRIIAPPIFGWIYALNMDAPWFAGAAMIALVVLVAFQAVGLLDRQRAAADTN